MADYVGICKFRRGFDKTYIPNWSTETFQGRKGQLTNPTTYLLKHTNNRDVLRHAIVESTIVVFAYLIDNEN